MVWFSRAPKVSSQVVHTIDMRLKQVEEQLLALQAAHERLRGRFYALKGPDSPPVPESKAEILKRMGFLR